MATLTAALSPKIPYLLGQYRAVSVAASVRGLTAGQIIATLTWANANNNFVLTRLACQLEVVTAITTAPIFDLAAYVFRGAAGNSSGSASTTISLVGNYQDDKSTMPTSLVSEIRTSQGSAKPLTADTSKTNDGAPFGFCSWGVLYNTSLGGTAVLVSPGAAMHPAGWNNLYHCKPGTHYPLTLAAGEGIEIQLVNDGNTVAASGTVHYSFLWEWAECIAI